MKKRISLFLAVIIMLSGFSTYAATNNVNAYSNLEKARPKEKKEIIAARKKIVYGNKSWTVNGQVSIKKKDGSIEKLPEFKDLYPNWRLEDLMDKQSLPKNQGWTIDGQISKRDVNGKITKLPERSDLILRHNYPGIKISSDEINYKANLSLSKDKNTFYSFKGDGSKVNAFPDNLSKGNKINIAFTNQDINQDIAWGANLSDSETLVLSSKDKIRYLVKASANSKIDKILMTVE